MGFCSLSGMAELVGLWGRYGFHAKTYRQDDGAYSAIITTPDYDTEEEVLAFLEELKGIVRG